MRAELGGVEDFTARYQLMVQANRLAEAPYGGKATWEAEEPEGGRGAARRNFARDREVLARFDAVNMWLRTAYFLRGGYFFFKEGDQEGDRIYRDFRYWHKVLARQEPAAASETLDAVDAEIAEAKRTGKMPRFEPVAMVTRAPLI